MLDLSDPAVQSAMIAAFVAVVVTLVGQGATVYLQRNAHKQTLERETATYYNEVYKKLFAPAISDVFLYVDMVSTFRRGHDTTPEREIAVKDRAMEYIQDNLVYASPKLISAYHHIHSYNISQQSGLNPTTAELEFLYVFIQEYVRVITRSSIYLEPEASQLTSVYQRLIVFFLYINGHKMLASYHWQFSNTAYTKRNYQRIVSLIRKQDVFDAAYSRKRLRNRDRVKQAGRGKRQETAENSLMEASINQFNADEREKVEARKATIRKVLTVLMDNKEEREMLLQDFSRNYHYLQPESPER